MASWLASLPANQPTSQPASQARSQTARQPGSQASQEASKPANQQAKASKPKPASQQGSKPASQQASKPARQQARSFAGIADPRRSLPTYSCQCCYGSTRACLRPHNVFVSDLMHLFFHLPCSSKPTCSSVQQLGPSNHVLVARCQEAQATNTH